MREDIRRERRSRCADLNVHSNGAQERTGRRRYVVTIAISFFLSAAECIPEQTRSVREHKFSALRIEHIAPPSFGYCLVKRRYLSKVIFRPGIGCGGCRKVTNRRVDRTIFNRPSDYLDRLLQLMWSVRAPELVDLDLVRLYLHSQVTLYLLQTV